MASPSPVNSTKRVSTFPEGFCGISLHGMIEVNARVFTCDERSGDRLSEHAGEEVFHRSGHFHR